MVIDKNKVVSFHYRVSEPGGELVEDSHAGSPVVYLHGHGGMLKGLEEALAGKQAGERVEVTLAPEKAYGNVRENADARISPKHVVGYEKKVKLRPGMVVQIKTPQGPREVTVLKVGLKTLDVDTNHPLAGKTLRFEIEVVDVRDASEEELAHGHVHGDGGHHH